MKAWLSEQHHALKVVLRRFALNPLSNAFTVLVIGIALSLPCGLFVVLENLSGLASQFQSDPEISLFLKTDAAADAIHALETKLHSNPLVGEVRFIGKNAALKEFARNAGIDDVVASLQKNPLPDTFVVQARDSSPDNLEVLRAELSQLPDVEMAHLDLAWAKRMHALLEFGNRVVVAIAVLLGLALVAITGNTIRLQIATQHDEIEVSKLIGATNRFIRRPFLYYGALQGLAGGVAAWAIVAAGIHLLKGNAAELASLYSVVFEAHLMPMQATMGLLLLSGALGYLGAYVAVNQTLQRFE